MQTAKIITALSDGYMRVRVAVLRTLIHYCVEGRGVSPWRTHWPEDWSDDALMADYLTVLSLRYTDYGVVEASLTHVTEFHKGFLRVAPPPLPIARWTLSKIKRLLAIEFPLGRRVRPGLLMSTEEYGNRTSFFCIEMTGRHLSESAGAQSHISVCMAT